MLLINCDKLEGVEASKEKNIRKLPRLPSKTNPGEKDGWMEENNTSLDAIYSYHMETTSTVTSPRPGT